MRSFLGLKLVIFMIMITSKVVSGLRGMQILQKSFTRSSARSIVKTSTSTINRCCTSLCGAKGEGKQPESAKHRRERTKDMRSRQEIMPENNYGVLGNMDGSGGSAAISWYPGHIAKAERELSEYLKKVDVVIEVRDARIPVSTTHPSVPEWVRAYVEILILLNYDMAISLCHGYHIAHREPRSYSIVSYNIQYH